MTGWHPCEWMPAIGRSAKRRAIAWSCQTDARLRVRHCGHPTANYPYWVEIDGVSKLSELGTFRSLDQAQAAAMRAAEG
jgi:hypothetical protein